MLPPTSENRTSPYLEAKEEIKRLLFMHHTALSSVFPIWTFHSSHLSIKPNTPLANSFSPGNSFAWFAKPQTAEAFATVSHWWPRAGVTEHFNWRIKEKSRDKRLWSRRKPRVTTAAFPNSSNASLFLSLLFNVATPLLIQAEHPHNPSVAQPPPGWHFLQPFYCSSANVAFLI